MSSEFYPGWADAAGAAAGVKERGLWYRTPAKERIADSGVEKKRRRSIIASQFEMGRVSLDVALQLTSEA